MEAKVAEDDSNPTRDPAGPNQVNKDRTNFSCKLYVNRFSCNFSPCIYQTKHPKQVVALKERDIVAPVHARQVKEFIKSGP